MDKTFFASYLLQPLNHKSFFKIPPIKLRLKMLTEVFSSPCITPTSKVKPLLSGRFWVRDNWLLNRGTPQNVGRGPDKKYNHKQIEVEKSRTMMVIIRSITLTKAKETITCTDPMCL